MIYVSHRLEEVFAISDRVTVTRNGRDVATRDRDGADHPGGDRRHDRRASRRPCFLRRCRRSVDGATEELRVARRLRRRTAKTSASRRAPARSSASRASKARACRGCSASCSASASARSGGAVYPDGRGLPRSPTEAARRGVCLVPGDRRRNGLMLDQSILFNISQVVVGAMRGGSPLFSKARGASRARCGRSRSCASRRARPTRWSITCPAATSRRSWSASGWRSRRA